MAWVAGLATPDDPARPEFRKRVGFREKCNLDYDCSVQRKCYTIQNRGQSDSTLHPVLLASFDAILLSFEGDACPSLASLPPVPALAAPRDLSFTVSAPGARLAVTVGHGQSQTVAVGAAQQQPVAVLRYQYYG